ncbi:MAG: type IV secretion protein IcmD [Legionella sp.]|nr:type IV secretion protein IcmD [Legionella sp.]
MDIKDVENLGKGCWLISSLLLGMILFCPESMASDSLTLGTMADKITDSFANLAKLITAGSYLAGLGFAVGSIMKFKAHKDNPTQIPIGTPIALIFIASALLFLPTILGITGMTMFGKPGTTAGPKGTIFQ